MRPLTVWHGTVDCFPVYTPPGVIAGQRGLWVPQWSRLPTAARFVDPVLADLPGAPMARLPRN
jgi:hypothetical protein